MAIIKPTLNLVASEYTPEILNVTRASGATRVNAAGLVERVSAGTLRYDHDPTTLAGKGWLIEEARTNLCLQSEDFSTTWSLTNATLGSNTVTAPDGTTTADKLIDDAVDSVHHVTQAITVTNAVSQALSVWAKAAGNNWLRIYVPTDNKSAYFDLANGVVGTTTATSSSITAYPDGWYRCEMVFTSADTTLHYRVYTVTADDTATHAGGSSNGTYLWGAQCEDNKSFASSYIPTTTAAVTRSEDSVSVPLSDFDFNFNEQTIYLQSTATAFNGMAALAVYLNGSNTVSFFVNPTTTLRTHRQTSGLQGNLDFTKAAGIEFRAALSIAQDDVAFSVDGETPELDTGHNMNSTLTTVWLGSNGATSPYSGYISHVAIFNKAMSDADIQTITTG